MRLSAKLMLIASFGMLASCGFPGNQLTKEERLADMNWAFTIFEHNYAPSQLKKDTFGVDLTQVKAQCVAEAQQEMSNSEFIALFQRCIHSVRDAHVSGAQLNNGMLPEFAQIAHLGVMTARTRVVIDGQKQEAIRVVAPLKGSASATYPLQAGDLILAADGRKVADILKQDIVPYFNVGQDESDLSMAAMRFALRVSIEMALPTAGNTTLQVMRSGETFDVTLPWITEDLVAFSEKQKDPKSDDGGNNQPPAAIAFMDGLAQSFVGYDTLKAMLNELEAPLQYAGSRVMGILNNAFRKVRFNPIMKMILNGDFGAEIPNRLVSRDMTQATKIEPILPDQMIPGAIVTDKNGDQFAYIQIANFPGEDQFVDEFNRLFARINELGIKGLILDMIDNGGGSLIHGMRMANFLRKDAIVTPSLQVRLNNNWVNAFRTQAFLGATDAEKALASRILEKLREDMDAGLELSRPFSVASLDPFGLQAGQKIQCEKSGRCLPKDVRIALLVNEFCVSMCDIFADTVQDNDLGIIIGQRTMGGGGNVSPHALSPVSKMLLNLTESLIVSAAGTKYLENNGVEPDIYVDMVMDRETNFKESMHTAYQYVTGKLTPLKTAN